MPTRQASSPEKRRMKTEHVLVFIRVRVQRGVNLAVRDLRSSDPYVVLRMAKQKLKTRVIKRNINPVWNEDLTLSIEDPTLPVILEVYDKDTFSRDDPMGHAEFEIDSFVKAVMMYLDGVPDGCIRTKLAPNKRNCLAKESAIYVSDGKVCQDLVLRLRNVESGEVELQLQGPIFPAGAGACKF